MISSRVTFIGLSWLVRLSCDRSFLLVIRSWLVFVGHYSVLVGLFTSNKNNNKNNCYMLLIFSVIRSKCYATNISIFVFIAKRNFPDDVLVIRLIGPGSVHICPCSVPLNLVKIVKYSILLMQKMCLIDSKFT